MAAIIEKVKVSSEIIVGIEREEIFSPKIPAELLVAAVEESGEDQSGTVTVVTPRKDHVYHLPSKFIRPVQEINMAASAELVC